MYVHKTIREINLSLLAILWYFNISILLLYVFPKSPLNEFKLNSLLRKMAEKC